MAVPTGKWDCVLSVRWDGGYCQQGSSPEAYSLVYAIQDVIEKKFGRSCYNPNYHSKQWDRFMKPQYHTDHAIQCRGFDCPSFMNRSSSGPNSDWCWGGSFYWHLASVRNARDGCMIQQVFPQDGKPLGGGQVLEQAMANHLGLRIIKMNCDQRQTSRSPDSVEKQLFDQGFERFESQCTLQ
mmetsp:Transcript_86913/g.243539  ORF Transcript_86913/g.243539 Transcript_86913/m.243539 type:complete len:182 (+) Transcript_86913:108-653(+)